MIAELILYACPVGALADQLDEYFRAAEQRCGRNDSHGFMPHVSLTGFFHDDADQVGFYAGHARAASASDAAVMIERMMLRDDFHALLVTSPWLQSIAATFAASAAGSPTRVDEIRVKSDLHLSLAYGFPPDRHRPLADLAADIVDITAPVAWEIRLYERDASRRWVLHHCSAAIEAAPRVR